MRGVSELFSIQLSPNFSCPLFSRSFSELWNRWHISLSHWLRDYVFFPLSRALYRRQPDPRRWANLALPPLVTLLASGLWHQASWEALLWGGAMGVCLVVERWWALQRPVALPGRTPAWRGFT
ncbi:MAG: MBOAT family O-acyltransferase [Chloroflexota bacterium]